MMLAEYYKEKDGLECIILEHSFLTYKIENEQFYIADFYLGKTKRKSKDCVELMRAAHKIAIQNKCVLFGCHVDPKINKCTEVLLIRIKFGFKMVGIEKEKIAMLMRVEDMPWAEV